jgi:hypothetical protein
MHGKNLLNIRFTESALRGRKVIEDVEKKQWVQGYFEKEFIISIETITGCFCIYFAI